VTTTEALGSYTVEELKGLAGLVASRFGAGISRDDAVEVAYDAMLATLLNEEGGRTKSYLAVRARGAVLNELRRRTRTVNASELEAWAPGGEDEEDFVQLIFDRMNATPDHAPGIVERMAVRQVYASLPRDERMALTALAVTQNKEAARKRLRMRTSRFNETLRLARQHFLEAWHEGETPSELPPLIKVRYPHGYRKRKSTSGATYNRRRRHWMARAYTNGKRVYLGVYKTRDAAVAAVRNYKQTEDWT
jgi:DNA-directed RNA polymerase specialized sigma24 family protein